MDNIVMADGIPRFGWHCVQCLRCIYACPENSIYPLVSRFMVIRGGYDLHKMAIKAEAVLPETDEEIASGAYAFFKEYIGAGNDEK